MLDEPRRQDAVFHKDRARVATRSLGVILTCGESADPVRSLKLRVRHRGERPQATVTDFASARGLSTSRLSATAMK